MTDLPTVSVIVVSHGRPALLRRALIGIAQLFYRPFELVVVADEAGLEAISDLSFADRIKTALQDTPNISVARNAGIALSSGQIVAFIDDDAVPEPTWLNHLVSPLLETEYAATTGTVLGRNGISVQWANRVVDRCGVAYPNLPGPLPDGLAVKLEGTNMAIRRQVAVGLGGFDGGFGFYLDETDLAYRMMLAGYAVTHTPLAVVHHGFAASERRTENRVPLSLFQIGQSSMLYLRKHAPEHEHAPAIDHIRAEQSDRVRRLVGTNALSQATGDVLLQSLEDGFTAGASLTPVNALADHAETPFQPLSDAKASPPILLAGRWTSRANMLRQASRAAAANRSVTLMIFDHTMRAHQVKFLPEGIWLQSGGLFGRSSRNQRRFTLWSLHRRIGSETDRLKKIRWISKAPECNTCDVS